MTTSPIEEFRDYHGYRVGNLGTVLGLNGKPLKLHPNHKGYLRVFLSIHNRHRWYRVHRLVAELFVANPFPRLYDQVDHRDGDVSNCAYNNLAWCCDAQNKQAKYNLRRLQGKPTLTEREAKALAYARSCRRRRAA